MNIILLASIFAPLLTLGIMGLLLGLGLAYAADVFKVEIDERIEAIDGMLPGYNCGACGYPGCAGFAENIIEGSVEKLTLCKPGKDQHYNAILDYLKDHPNKDGSLIQVKK